VADLHIMAGGNVVYAHIARPLVTGYMSGSSALVQATTNGGLFA
jgi:hypothetical protein